MVRIGLSGNLMSLGALDFGLIVDGSVVMVENILRRLRGRKPDESTRDVVQSAGEEVARPIFFGIAIIVLVYVPILTLSGVEGKMFRPMATTVLLAVLASLVVALTVMPVLSWAVLRGTRAQEVESDTWIMRRFHRWYEPALACTLRFPKLTVAIALVIFAGSLIAVPFLGREFIPRLDEGSIVIMMYRLPGISLGESKHGNQIIEGVLKRFPEVETVVSRTGRPEVATDPMALDQSDVYVMLKPRSEWPAHKTKDQLIGEMKARLEEEAPGAGYSFSQPIQMRMQELTEAGVRSDVAAKLYGDDLKVMRQKAQEAAAVIQRIPGAADVRAEVVAGEAGRWTTPLRTGQRRDCVLFS